MPPHVQISLHRIISSEPAQHLFYIKSMLLSLYIIIQDQKKGEQDLNMIILVTKNRFLLESSFLDGSKRAKQDLNHFNHENYLKSMFKAFLGYFNVICMIKSIIGRKEPK